MRQENNQLGLLPAWTPRTVKRGIPIREAVLFIVPARRSHGLDGVVGDREDRRVAVETDGTRRVGVVDGKRAAVVQPYNAAVNGAVWRPVVEQSVTAFRKCGDLHQGFARVRCPDCHQRWSLVHCSWSSATDN
jgi:hypothetical protein